MSKTTCTYWNPLDGEQQHRWRWLEGLEGQVEELILSHDNDRGCVVMDVCSPQPPGS